MKLSNWLGRRMVASQGGSDYFVEKEWSFSKASKGGQALVIALGGLNLAGDLILSGLLRDYSVIQSLRGSGLIPFAAKALPFLQAYTTSFYESQRLGGSLIRDIMLRYNSGTMLDWVGN